MSLSTTFDLLLEPSNWEGSRQVEVSKFNDSCGPSINCNRFLALGISMISWVKITSHWFQYSAIIHYSRG